MTFFNYEVVRETQWVTWRCLLCHACQSLHVGSYSSSEVRAVLVQCGCIPTKIIIAFKNHCVTYLNAYHSNRKGKAV